MPKQKINKLYDELVKISTSVKIKANKYDTKIIEKLKNNEDIENINYFELFIKACINNHLKLIKLLLKKNVFDINDVIKEVNNSWFNNTGLHISCSKGYIKIVDLLLNNGADTDIINDDKNTPLHIACSKGYIKIVDLLLNNGADTNIINDNNTPLHIAIIEQNIPIINLLLKKTNISLFQIKFVEDMFETLFDLGPIQCGAICLNTMGFNKDIVERLKTNSNITFEDMEIEINKFIEYVEINEPYRLYEGNKDKRVKLNIINVQNFSINKNFYFIDIIYEILFKSLKKRFCTIIGYGRIKDYGHFTIVAKSDSNTLYIYCPQSKQMFRGEDEIKNYFKGQDISTFELYKGNIRLRPPREFSQVNGNLYRPQRMPSINPIFNSPNSVPLYNNTTHATFKNTLEPYLATSNQENVLLSESPIIPFEFGNTRGLNKRTKYKKKKDKKKNTQLSTRRHKKKSKKKKKKR